MVTAILSIVVSGVILGILGWGAKQVLGWYDRRRKAKAYKASWDAWLKATRKMYGDD